MLSLERHWQLYMQTMRTLNCSRPDPFCRLHSSLEVVAVRGVPPPSLGANGHRARNEKQKVARSAEYFDGAIPI